MLEGLQWRCTHQDSQISPLLPFSDGPVNLPCSACDSSLRHTSYTRNHSSLCHISSHYGLHHELLILLSSGILQEQKSDVCLLCQKDSSTCYGGGAYRIPMGFLRLCRSLLGGWVRMWQYQWIIQKIQPFGCIQNHIKGDCPHTNYLLHRWKTCWQLLIV